MNNRIKFLITGIFLAITFFFLITYWIKNQEDSFADEIISDASNSFKKSLNGFTLTVSESVNEITQNISEFEHNHAEFDDLNEFFSKMILSNSYLKGVALSNDNFTYLIYRDNSSWATTYDNNISDTIANWKRMNNKLEIVSEWTDVFRSFPNGQDINQIKNELKNTKYIWKVSNDQIPEVNDLLSILFEAPSKNSEPFVVGLVYSAQDLRKNFTSVLKFEKPLISILTSDSNIVTPIITSDTNSIAIYNNLSIDIKSFFASWRKSKNKEPHSYTFEKFKKIYWTRIVALKPNVGVNGFAVTISAMDLAETERKQELIYLYISIVFSIITIIIGIVIFRKKKVSKSNNQDLEPLSNMELLEIINKGETEYVEFKSSLRWDYRENKVNKVLETVILKSINAFANAKGGKLLIGVSDDLNILGLENDFYSLKKNDADYFELHLRKLINNQYGISFSNDSLSMSFNQFDKKTICLIQITSSDKPIFLKTKSKQGAEVEKFYVRSGNASQEISSLTEINDYIKVRFDN